MKYLMILLILFTGIVLIGNYIVRKIKRFFITLGTPPPQQAARKKQEDEVLYRSEDVVVLKGDAGKKDNGEN